MSFDINSAAREVVSETAEQHGEKASCEKPSSTRGSPPCCVRGGVLDSSGALDGGELFVLGVSEILRVVPGRVREMLSAGALNCSASSLGSQDELVLMYCETPGSIVEAVALNVGDSFHASVSSSPGAFAEGESALMASS